MTAAPAPSTPKVEAEVMQLHLRLDRSAGQEQWNLKVTLLSFTCVLVVLNGCMNEVVALDTDVDSMHAHMRLTGG